ncbi:hypothetical protein GBK02_15855 [Dechloromonas sp. TW-R-39-2]|uniref:hypothetical protein n=1 Tax=Dechloromonas sp. TW-R-39-2 TaxID=2654218 RepID=UPI00193CC46C|nr:hypothetical protein [Dechloromonas sp. TW-R-39-2]QRM20744.1 hypothetical protein GBK02_15855 [Dechloromonas sp. TW-R-39-2]
MTKSIRKVIRENRDKVTREQLVGTKLLHPDYGKGRVIDYCNCCYLAEVKFEGHAKPLTRHFDSIFVKGSEFRLSDKQLDQKFGHLRADAVPQPPKFLCSTPPLATPGRAKAVKDRLMKRNSQDLIVKSTSSIRIRGGSKPPSGAKTLF